MSYLAIGRESKRVLYGAKRGTPHLVRVHPIIVRESDDWNMEDEMKVFLSHSSRDKALVREIRSQLPDRVKTWLDEDELLVGQDLKISIKSAIQEDADFVVIFLGKEAVGSEWVKRELEWSLEREKNIGRVFVLPVLLDDVWDMVEPAEFRNRLYIKCLDQSEDAVRGVARKLSDNIFSWLSRH